MLDGGRALTGKQVDELHSATGLITALDMAMKHMFDAGSTEEDLVALMELVSVVTGKLNFVGSEDDLDAALSRVPNMSKPEKLSGLIVQLLKAYRESGDMQVYAGDMKRLGELEVVTAPEDPEKHGARFLHIGSY